MLTKTNPIVPPHLALEIEAGGESVPLWLERMEKRIAALTQAKLEAGCPPDLEALGRAIERGLAADDELRKYLLAKAVHRQMEEILADRGYRRDPHHPDLWHAPEELGSKAANLASLFVPSPRRKPGSKATSELLQSWIPAFAGMTKEGELRDLLPSANPLTRTCCSA